VDCIIFDPPYGIGNSKLEHKGKKWEKSHENWDTFASIDEQYEFYKECLSLLFPLLKDTGNIFMFGSFHNIYMLGEIVQRQLDCKIVNSIVWYKENAMFSLTRSSLIESTEHVIWAAKSSTHFFDYEESKRIGGTKQLRNVWTGASPGSSSIENEAHPHQKPLWLIERLLKIGCPMGGFVLDPMAGSGTTGVICESRKLPYLLCEKDVTYFDLAKNRVMKYAAENQDLFE
jgi:site-specific DNA-methyltransferase (adenine-specific)